MAVCLATSVTARSAANRLFERQSACPVSSFVGCSRAGLPADFCCPTGQTCIPLAANTTVLCCPNGQDCSTIRTITCDVQLQNITAHPDNTLKTTVLNVPLPTCGSGCCPFGFACNANGNCVIDADQTVAPGASSSSAPSSTATTTSKPAATSSSSSTSTPLPLTAQCNKFPATAVLAGFFPGLALGIGLALLYVCFVNRHELKNFRKRRSGSSFGNISDPQPIGDTRTDFLRKPPTSPSTTRSGPSRRNTIQRVRSIFGKSPSANGLPASPAPPMPLNIRRPMPQEQQRPVTPIMQREPSYEDISIFTDNTTANSLRDQERQHGRGGGVDVRASHQTTFSDMMDRSGVAPAGLKKNSREYPNPRWF
ncbi:hypothetical protein N431DRAFT_458217 [Stipitochalara longipes BDJ]|nr:hypothetical protein N431DRAFT_458217 [Stipitochalara longipes BDJ]